MQIHLILKISKGNFVIENDACVDVEQQTDGWINIPSISESAKEQTMFCKMLQLPPTPDLHNILHIIQEPNQIIADYSFHLFLYSVSPFLIFHNKVQ